MYNHLSDSYVLYFSIQEKYPDHIVCMEVGTFYEIHEYKGLGFSTLTSEVLDIELTSKQKQNGDHPLMSGFPTKTAEKYLRRLTKLGYSVVIVSQKDIPGQKKKDRFVEKILSPSTYLDELENQEKSNYFSCIYIDDEIAGVSSVDITTGEVVVTELETKELDNYLDKLRPTEILSFGNYDYNKKFKSVHIKDQANINKLNQCGKLFSHIYEEDHISENYSNIVSKLGLGMFRYGALSFGNLLDYFSGFEESKNLLRKIDYPRIENYGNELQIPLNGIKSLEIFESFDGEYQGSLISVLNNCKTVMGRRLLNERLKNPFTDIIKIKEQHNKIESYIKNDTTYEELNTIFDIERISRRFVFRNISPRQMGNLIKSFEGIGSILEKEDSNLINKNKKILKFLENNIDKEKALIASKNSFGYFKGKLFDQIKEEYCEIEKLNDLIDKELENYREIGTKYSKAKLKLEIEKGDFSYIVKCSKKFSQISETKNKIKVMKQYCSIENSRINELLKDKFNKEIILNSKARKALLNFQNEFIENHLLSVKEISRKIAEIDLLQNFKKISIERGYVRPKITKSISLNLKNVRHPVVEISNCLENNYVSNSVNMNKDKNIICLYGANSSGKSTLLKASALSIIMNQIGCYIPAAEGSELSIFEYILTRMTTFDSLSEGFSTFTMEMHELQEALRFKDKKSLFLLDEIGRGTSPEDGEAIAFSVLEHLSSNNFKGVAFFATHYHELYNKIKNYRNIEVFHTNVDVKDNKLILYRDLKKGPGNGSYGIKVAESCGIPKSLIRSATNYYKEYAPLKKSRYNSNEYGIVCEWCKIRPVEETHHLEEQLQGKRKRFERDDGSILSINDKRNIIMLCRTCHGDITNKKLILDNKEDFKNKDNREK